MPPRTRWAYESQRYIREVKVSGQEPRWQFMRLAEQPATRSRFRIIVLSKENLDAMARDFGWIP
jgi:hypothetical protein